MVGVSTVSPVASKNTARPEGSIAPHPDTEPTPLLLTVISQLPAALYGPPVQFLPPEPEPPQLIIVAASKPRQTNANSRTKLRNICYSLTSVTDGTRTFRGCRNRGIMPPYAPISWKISRSVYDAIRARQASLAAAAPNSG